MAWKLIEFHLITRNCFLGKQTASDCDERFEPSVNKLADAVHVQFPLKSEHSYSLQVNFNPPVLLPRTPSKNELPWKFHEHVPPLNLRISFRPKKVEPEQLDCLRMFFARQVPQKHAVSRHVSPLFLKFLQNSGACGGNIIMQNLHARECSVPESGL